MSEHAPRRLRPSYLCQARQGEAISTMEMMEWCKPIEQMPCIRPMAMC